MRANHRAAFALERKESGRCPTGPCPRVMGAARSRFAPRFVCWRTPSCPLSSTVLREPTTVNEECMGVQRTT